MASLWAELRRRNVASVGIAYAVAGWLVIEVSSVVLPAFNAPGWILQALIILVVIGFPLTLILAWAFELTPEGLKRDADVGARLDRSAHPRVAD